MPERDEPDFDWLYGTQGKGVGSSGRGDRGDRGAPAAGDDDATRVQPVQGGRPSSRDPEPTQKLPTMNRRGSERARGSGSERASAAPYQAPPPVRPRQGALVGRLGR